MGMDNNRDGTGKGQLSRLEDASRLALSPQSGREKCKPSVASARATMLFGCYPAGSANDPEMFITAAAAMLASYPELVVERVCDPIRGLPAKNKFLPAIAEIRAACETEMVWHDAVERRDRERRHTAEVLAPAPAPTADARARVKAMAADLLAELNAGGEPRKMDFRPPRSPAEAEAARRHFEARLPELAAEYSSRPAVIGIALRNATEAHATGCKSVEAGKEDCR
jgi:hypothetical protein